MFRTTQRIIQLAVLVSLCSTVMAADYLSPYAIVADNSGNTIYVGMKTASQIAVFDVKSEKVVKTIALPADPSGMVLSPKGTRLFAVAGGYDGKLFVIDVGTAKIKDQMSLGHTPSALAISPDGKTIYVCNRYNNNVAVIDTVSKKQTATIEVAREPVSITISPDGKKLVVANLLPAGRADGSYSSSVITVIDTGLNKVVKNIILPNGSMAVKGMCMSPDGKYAYATHILARYQLPTTQLERGWINTNAISVIDVEANKLVNTALLDDVDLGAANPWGVTCTADGKNICVALSGTQEICVIDRAGMHAKLGKAASNQKVSDATSSAEDVPNDLAFLVGIKKRIAVEGNGPRQLVEIGRKVYFTEYFTGTLGVTEMDSKARVKSKSVELGKQSEMSVVRKGEMFFHDAALCFQKWQSCSSCHPGEGRADALNWDLMNDGLGNPKNTKSLMLAHQTPPAMVTAVRANAEIAVRAGIRHIQFAVRPDEDAVAIDEYCKSLKPVPSPHLLNGQLSPSAKRGQKIYVDTGCVRCHPGPLFTNLKTYDVGTGIGREQKVKFDTPTLIESWRTGPYLHDGRAATMKEVFTTFNKDDKHGQTLILTDQEVGDLAEYVMSL